MFLSKCNKGMMAQVKKLSQTRLEDREIENLVKVDRAQVAMTADLTETDTQGAIEPEPTIHLRQERCMDAL